MVRLILQLSITLWVASVAANAHAGRFICKPDRDTARIATLDGDAVVVVSDEASKQCHFSINGEPTGSQPRGPITAAVNLLRSGSPSEELATKIKVDWLALLLLSASPDPGIDDVFRTQLLANRNELANCFKALEVNTFDLPIFNSESRSLFCGGIPSGAARFEFAKRFSVVVESAVPFLVVGAKRNESASYLFVPFGLFRSPLPR
jgi:hypothetical protein